jgi:rhamnose utilization protein RhaD (predicted bifunctional aldolase and dehydrogenase)
MRDDIIRFCHTIRKDPLLVQGAGGNVSWKEGDTLWVKASGTRLAEAAEKDIFVPVDMAHLRAAFRHGDFNVAPQSTVASQTLRPSIETPLHALLSHRVVVHLHAVDILACLVREDAHAALTERLSTFPSWVMVDYHKPGADLAKAVHAVLLNHADVNVIFLKNHGVIVGGESVREVDTRLSALLRLFSWTSPEKNSLLAPASPIEGYAPVSDTHLHHFACNGALWERLEADWALYPDHVVFLGAHARQFLSWDEMENAVSRTGTLIDLVFIRDKGVYVTPAFTETQRAQLRCYYDVLERQLPGTRLAPLSSGQVADLLDWDAEKYRKMWNMFP